MKTLRLAFVGAALMVAVALAGAGVGRGTEPAFAATHQVSITDGGFVPASLTVAVGDTVVWTNNSSTIQSAVAQISGPNFFNSSFIYQTQSYQFTFPASGTVPYKSLNTGITGTIEVDGSGTPVPTATATAVGSPTPSGNGTYNVSITNGGFVPASLNIAAGETVVWTNNSSTIQSAVAQISGPNFFNSSFIYQGQSYQFTFPASGTVPYKSLNTGITGTIVVGGGGGGGSSPTPTVPPATATSSPTGPAGTPTPTRTATPVPPTQAGTPSATPTATPTNSITVPPSSTATPTPTGPTSPPSTAPVSTPTPTPTRSPKPYGDPDNSEVVIPGLVKA